MDIRRFPVIDAEWPPPATVLHLACPRCRIPCKMTDRLARAAYPTGDHRPVCMACDLTGEVVELELVKVIPVQEERRQLERLEAVLVKRRAAGGLAPLELAIVNGRISELARERTGLERYLGQLLVDHARIERDRR